MQKWRVILPVLAGVGVMVMAPVNSWAQDGPVTGLSNGIGGLQATLENVYNTMMVHCGELRGVSQGIAGFGALLYISYRIWGNIARGDQIDVFPLLRPFGLGLLLIFYSNFIGALNFVLQPTVAGTAALVNDENAAITTLLQQKETALEQSTDWQMYVGSDGGGSQDKWEQYSGEAESGAFSGLTNAVKFQLARISYNFRNGAKVVLSEILQIVYEAAALCINTLRTFELLLMAILGPLVIALSVYDPFRSVLSNWLGRYINVFLWLPVANICGSLCGQIQAEMIKIDIAQIQASGSTGFSSTDVAYIIFLMIAIVAYTCVPSITNHIISVFPYGGGALSNKVSGKAEQAAAMAGQIAVAAGGGVGKSMGTGE
jgi:conjugative transposon TraJ protein